MAEAHQFPDQKFQNLASYVCLIEIKDEEGDHYKAKGTGFHYGGGWVMSNAHVFQDDQRDDNTTHSVVSRARFTFLKFCEDEEGVADQDTMVREATDLNTVTFNPHHRTAFIHHLKPGTDIDIKNKDIAMVKLGHQSEYGHNDEWENGEETHFTDLQLNDDWRHITAFAESHPPKPLVGEEVYGFHFGDPDNSNGKFVRSTITHIEEATGCRYCVCCNIHSIYTCLYTVCGAACTETAACAENIVPLLQLDNTENAFPPGSSGCPVMIQRDGKYRLAALNFAGDDKTECALRWTRGIEDHIGNKGGVSITSIIGPYLSYIDLAKNIEEFNMGHANKLYDVALKIKKLLEQKATDHQLTIYLTNEETINSTAA